MPANRTPIANLGQRCQNYLESLKQLVRHPAKYFAARQKRTNRLMIVLEALPFVLLPALLTGASSTKLTSGLLLFVGAYLGLCLLTVVERYILLFFNESRSFAELFDFVFGLAPALVLSWIPVVGLPATLVLAGFWNWLGLKHQIKMNSDAALAAAGLPVFLTGVLMFCLTILVGPWVGAMQSLSGH